MSRTIALYALCFLVLSALPAFGAEGTDRFHVSCCLGSLEQAKAYAEELSQTIPGLTTEIEPMVLTDKKGGQRTIYNIYMSHPEMSTQEICAKLGQEKCPQQPRTYPESGTSPPAQEAE